MSRYVRDPWAKKTKKGMKTLGKMFDAATTVGAAMYASSKTKPKTSTPKYTSTSSNTIPTSSAGCLVFVIGAIATLIVPFFQDDFSDGVTCFFLIAGSTLLLFMVVSYMFPDGSKSNSQSTKSPEVNKYNPPTHTAIPNELVAELSDKIINMSSVDDIENSIAKLESVSYKEELLLKSLDSALSHICCYSEVPSEFEHYIDSIALKYSLSDTKMQGLSNYVEYVKSLIIQDILNGVLPKRITVGPNPINMQVNEVPIFVFPDTVYYEESTTKTYLGASSGLSVRVCKGVYYRVGAFKGQPLITTSLKPKYGGCLIFTNMNIYFYSREKTIKFPYSKILSYVPNEDAIGIQLDRANAKTVYIKNIDGRFAFNLVTNIRLINS